MENVAVVESRAGRDTAAMDTSPSNTARPLSQNAHRHEPAAAAPIPASIRVLRRLHPLVVALLRSPLHGLLSRDVLLLHYRGRRSGRALTLPISYVEEGGAIYLCTRPGGSVWWRNLAGGVEVEVTLRGRRCGAHAEVLEPQGPEALAALRAFLTRNPGTGELLYDVHRTAGGPNAEDLAREVTRSVVVRLRRGDG
jgi:deazaflavin-dependent oxidoreductase (nitroreductase family)